MRFSKENFGLPLVLALCLTLGGFSPPALAQDKAGADQILADTKADMLTVVGVGLAGAVLGLSTLSFYSEPKDHFKNILVGGAIGIIIGVGLVAYNQATKSRDTFYQSGEEEEASLKFSPQFDPFENVQTAGLEPSIDLEGANQIQFNFTF